MCVRTKNLPVRLTMSRSANASSKSKVIGLSQITLNPASRNSFAIGKWRLFGVTIDTKSIHAVINVIGLSCLFRCKPLRAISGSSTTPVAYSAVSIRSQEARTPGHGRQTPQNCVRARPAATFVHSLLPRIPPRLKQALAQLPPALGLPAEPTPKPILDLPATKPETAQNPASDLLHSHPPPPSGL